MNAVLDSIRGTFKPEAALLSSLPMARLDFPSATFASTNGFVEEAQRGIAVNAIHVSVSSNSVARPPDASSPSAKSGVSSQSRCASSFCSSTLGERKRLKSFAR